MKEWLQEHTKRKTFLVSAAAMVIAVILLIVEFAAFGYSITKIIRYLSLLTGLFFIGWIDGEKYIIPNRILNVLAAVRCILLITECLLYTEAAGTFLLTAFGGALIGFVIFGICYLVSRGAMGAGDVKLFAVIGFYTGLSGVMSIAFLAACAGSLFAIVNLIRKKTKLKESIPFGPFVLIATIVAFGLGI